MYFISAEPNLDEVVTKLRRVTYNNLYAIIIIITEKTGMEKSN